MKRVVLLFALFLLPTLAFAQEASFGATDDYGGYSGSISVTPTSGTSTAGTLSVTDGLGTVTGYPVGADNGSVASSSNSYIGVSLSGLTCSGGACNVTGSSTGTFSVVDNGSTLFSGLLSNLTEDFIGGSWVIHGYAAGTLGTGFATTGSLVTLTFTNGTAAGITSGLVASNIGVDAVLPEPDRMALLGSGLVAIAGLVRRKSLL
jgi:hypothetical protein